LQTRTDSGSNVV